MESGTHRSHPYLPSNLRLEGFVENDKTNVSLLSTFFGILFACLLVVHFVVSRNKYTRQSTSCQLKIHWFFTCGFIHIILEGYYFFNFRTLATTSSFLAQMWKEYSICDSRYIGGDSFVVCMEGITALVDGPLALCAVYAFLTNHQSRHIIQLIVSLCQLYGDVLYLATEFLEDFSHGPYGDPLYFWFYFVFLNVLWIVIPVLCMSESLKVLTKACLAYDSNLSHETIDKRNQ